MRAVDELTGPFAYSGWWTVVAVALGLAVIGLYAVLAWRGLRPDPRPSRPHPGATPDERARTLAGIDAIDRDVREGRLDRRAATTALSPLVRAFVGSATGAPVAAMTLADLQRSGLPQLPELVAVLYPPQFAPESSADTLELVGRAREVVSTWR